MDALKGLRNLEPCEPKNERRFNELAADRGHSSTILTILADARAAEAITDNGYRLFYQKLLADRALLDNPDVHIASRQAIQEFLLNPQEATAEVPMLAKQLLERYGFPGNLTMPLLHHPEIVASAKTALNEIPGIPDKGQVNDAMPENTLGPIAGDTQKKIDNLVKDNFNQKAPSFFSHAVGQFARSYGVSVKTSSTPLEQKNLDSVLDEFFRELS